MGGVDYDKVAPTYDQRYHTEIFAQLETWLRERAGGAGRNVVEVGCGTGHWLAVLADTGARVHGLDASAEMLAKARSRLPDVELVQGHAETLPWPDATFDRVICVNAIHHFGNKRGFVREARRVLAPGGIAMVIGLDPHRAEDRWWVYQYYESALALDRARFPSGVQVEAWMTESGLADVSTSLVQRLALRPSYDELVAEGQTAKQSASQLTLLSDEEYVRGLAQLERDAAAARARGETLVLDSDLGFYATVGTAR